MGGKGEGSSRNKYIGPINKVSGGGVGGWRKIECSRLGWVGRGRLMGENGDNCN